MIFFVVKENKEMVKFYFYAYSILGLMLFCLLLIYEIRSLTKQDYAKARPIEFYKLHMDIVLISLNVGELIFRIFGNIMMFFYSKDLWRIDYVIKNQLQEKFIADEKSVEDQVIARRSSSNRPTINYINHSCESIEKEDSLVKGSNKCRNNSISHLGKCIKRENDDTMVNSQRFSSDLYYKKILGS